MNIANLLNWIILAFVMVTSFFIWKINKLVSGKAFGSLLMFALTMIIIRVAIIAGYTDGAQWVIVAWVFLSFSIGRLYFDLKKYIHRK